MPVSLPVQAGLLLLISFGTSFVGERNSMAHRCRRTLNLEEVAVPGMSVVESNHARNGDVENKTLKHLLNDHTK
jgi:hypothetical protein